VLSNLPEVHTLAAAAAMGLLWALEKGDYAAHHVLYICSCRCVLAD
jgi:hypothetical protein